MQSALYDCTKPPRETAGVLCAVTKFMKVRLPAAFWH